jgi:hypothetical protein
MFKAIDILTKTLYKVELSNKGELETLISNVEKAVREIPETTQIDTRTHLDNIVKELKKLDLVVNVPEVNIPDNKKELLSIEKAVKDIKIPEVKIPEQKEVDFTVLIETILSLKKDLTGGNRPDDEKTQKAVLSVLTKLESGLSEIDKSVNKLKLDVNVPEVDLTKVIEASKATTKAINSLVFPVANFHTQGIIDAINDISTEEKPTVTYTWVGETLTQKVAVYSDRTETTDYTWTDGKLSTKETIIT